MDRLNRPAIRRALHILALLFLLATAFGVVQIHTLSKPLSAAPEALDALRHAIRFTLAGLLGLSVALGIMTLAPRRPGLPGSAASATANPADLTLNALPDAVLRFSLDGQLTQLNPAAERMIGIDQGDAIAQSLADTLNVIAREDRSSLIPALLQDLRQGNLASLGEQACLISQEGLELEVEGQAAPILAADGHAAEGVLVMRDVTEAREKQRKQAWLAEHDALTGMLNRKAFEDKLARVINSKRASEYPMTLLVIGIDSYDAVRNREGQSAGNELLIQTSRLLQNRLRDTDSIGRLDEVHLGITLAACPDDIALRIARTLHESLSQHKLQWGKSEYLVNISMGVVHIPRNWETLDRVMTAGHAACAQSRISRDIAVHAN